LRNVVQLITKKQKAEVGACEHCGTAENLESAHVRGRDRTEIIDSLLGTADPTDSVHVNVVQFEEDFISGHEPVEKAILILCRECHRSYDSNIFHQAASLEAASVIPDAGIFPASRATTEGTLPITLHPPRATDFKHQLLKFKRAEITIHYGDGRTETRQWNASGFSESSNVFGNLRSRPEFRRGEWQSRGIVKVHVRVLGDA
jgi:hypothetical protein